MNIQAGSRFACALLVMIGSARAQSPPSSATIDAATLTLTMPEHFRVISTLEPIRRVKLIAPADGVVRAIDAGIGTAVQANAQVAELDRREAAARLKIAEAELVATEARHRTAEAELAKARLVEANRERNLATETAQARVEAAQARVELARLEVDGLTLRAPFAGTIVDASVSSGQFVLKGTVIAELADLSALKAMVPVDRRSATVGGVLTVWVEDQEQTAKVKSIVPLPATNDYKPIRELASPLATAWIQLDNAKGTFEPGLRVRGPGLPIDAVATVSKRAVQRVGAESADGRVQVIRNEYVVNIPVKVLGEVGPERVQITGALRSSDALITSTSSPLQPGTLVRFGGGGAPTVEGTTPDPNREGQSAAISTPGQPAPKPTTPRAPRPAAPVQSGGGQPF